MVHHSPRKGAVCTKTVQKGTANITVKTGLLTIDSNRMRTLFLVVSRRLVRSLLPSGSGLRNRSRLTGERTSSETISAKTKLLEKKRDWMSADKRRREKRHFKFFKWHVVQVFSSYRSKLFTSTNKQFPVLKHQGTAVLWSLFRPALPAFVRCWGCTVAEHTRTQGNSFEQNKHFDINITHKNTHRKNHPLMNTNGFLRSPYK